MCENRIGIAGDAARKQTVLTSLSDGTDNIRGGARGGYTNHSIVGCRFVFQQVVPTLFSIIFSIFYSLAQRFVATGNKTDNPSGGNAKGRGQFAGIQHT